jgi:hypothetical protein
MSHLYNQALIHYVDRNGRTSCAFLTTQDQGEGGAGAYADVAAALQACSDAAIIAIQFQTTVLVSATPSTGDYDSVLDKAVILVPISGEARSTRLEIPAPKSSIFRADHVTVDLANADVIALDAECQAVLGDSDGHPWGPFRRGTRQRARGG